MVTNRPNGTRSISELLAEIERYDREAEIERRVEERLEEERARQRPITVVVNVTAADASSFRASQGQIAADMARAIDRASRNR
jgi:hypothetical protein